MINVAICLIVLYSGISIVISIYLVAEYFGNNINPFNLAKNEIKEINVIGDLFWYLFLFYGWLISVFLYYSIMIFYNKYTIFFMNIKIRK